MTKDSAQPYIFYLSKGKVSIFHPKLKTIVEIPLPDTIIKDQEVKKLADLDALLANFITQSKMPPSTVFLILSSEVVLEKILPNGPTDNVKDLVEKEVKVAPFNHVSFATVPAGKDITLILVNRELYEGFQEILERLGFHVSAVTPGRALGLPSAPFTTQIGNEIMKRTPLVFQNSFISDPDQIAASEANLSSDPRKNRKLLGLLVAFGVLIFLLGGLVIKMMVFDKPTAQVKQEQSAPTPQPTAAPTVTTPTASPSASIEGLRIQVLNASGETGAAASTSAKLISSGFKQVETGNSQTINAERIQVVFAPTVSGPVRDQFIQSLTPIFVNPRISEGTSTGDYDIVVTITKTSSI